MKKATKIEMNEAKIMELLNFFADRNGGKNEAAAFNFTQNCFEVSVSISRGNFEYDIENEQYELPANVYKGYLDTFRAFLVQFDMLGKGTIAEDGENAEITFKYSK